MYFCGITVNLSLSLWQDVQDVLCIVPNKNIIIVYFFVIYMFVCGPKIVFDLNFSNLNKSTLFLEIL